MNKIDDFIEYIASVSTPDKMSLNIYMGDSKEVEVRKEFLRYYLNEMRKLNPTRIFIGEAPGHNGCFNTGVPFTDENTIAHHPFFAGIREILITPTPQKESTASIIWERLSNISPKDYPLMWNIYPFHPSNIDSSHVLPEERINRNPNGRECSLGKEILEKLLNCFNIQQYYAIGCRARDTLKSTYTNIEYIRHPSHGGINMFRDGFNNIYKV